MKTLTVTLLVTATVLMNTSLVAATTNPVPLSQRAEQKINQLFDKLTPDEKSALEKRIASQRRANNNPLSIMLFRPNFVLPFYYTGTPDTAIYNGNTPDEQKIMHQELKAQLSVVIQAFPALFNDPNYSLNIAYTQLNYWQVYATSQYFRETNYEPEIFLEDHFHRNWLVRFGADHQSNGRGGPLERSWNRAIGMVQASGDNWIFSLKAWDLIFQKQSSYLHNPDIAHYLGYESMLFSYHYRQIILSMQVQNLESGLHKGSVEFSLSHPISKQVALYAQYFNGYGQSLLEYNHRTQSIGMGITLNDWQ